MSEEWRAVVGYEGIYEVSSAGSVRSLDRMIADGRKRKGKPLKAYVNKSGYAIVTLCRDGKTDVQLVHRIVANAFLSNPLNKPVVDHIDTNPANNTAENLRWVTISENCLNPLTRKHNAESKKGHKCYLEHHTEEAKRKMSMAHKGRPLTEEHKQKLREAKKKQKERTKK